MTTPAFYYGTGRRKTAVARVRLIPGSGEIVVNDRTLDAHFGNAIDEANVRLPFRVTGTEGTFNAQIKVEGGGVTGQAGAIRHGIARALLQLDPEGNRLPLRQAGTSRAVQRFVGACGPRSRTFEYARSGPRLRLALNGRLGAFERRGQFKRLSKPNIQRHIARVGFA
jgi:small subunit ribosomal protein S9